MAVLANSLPSIHLGGSSGIKLLKGLTNSSQNITDANNTLINLSNNRSLVPLSGSNGTVVMDNLSKSPANLSFGSTPRASPPPGKVDPKFVEFYYITRLNHLGY